MKTLNHIFSLLLFTAIISFSNKAAYAQCPSFAVAGNGLMTMTFANATERGTILSLDMHNGTDTTRGVAGSNSGSKAWKTSAALPAQYQNANLLSVHIIRSGDTIAGCNFSPNGSALPIELMYFKAERQGNNTLLTWATASEENNSHFTVERSIDNENWEVVGIENGAGNSINMLKYEMIDYTPVIGTVYYRLRQDDYNGDYTYSNTVVVTANDKLKLNIMGLYVENNTLRVSLEGADQEEPIEVQIYSLLGSVEKSETFNNDLTNSNGNQVNMDVSALTDGVYTITVTQGSEVITGKFIK